MSNNYFAIFKIEPTFNISFDELEKKYIELSRADINLMKSQNMKNINKAYQILKSPLKRAQHLLDLLGMKSRKEHLDAEILDESLKIRELLLECNNLHFISEMINEKIKDCTKSLISAFDTKNSDEATTQVLRLQYLYKSFEEVRKSAASSNF